MQAGGGVQRYHRVTGLVKPDKAGRSAADDNALHLLGDSMAFAHFLRLPGAAGRALILRRFMPSTELTRPAGQDWAVADSQAMCCLPAGASGRNSG